MDGPQIVANPLDECAAELGLAHQIILNALSVMTPEQKSHWAKLNAITDCDGFGATRHHERAEVLRRLGREQA